MGKVVTIPNALTLSRLVLLPGVILLSRKDMHLTSVSLFLIMLITDVLDGYAARRLKQESALGLYLDPVVDKIIVLALVYEMGISGLIPIVIPHLLLARELLANAVRAWAGTLGKIVPANWMGKSKMFLESALITWGLAMPVLIRPESSQLMLTSFCVAASLILTIAWVFLCLFIYRNRALFAR